MSRFQDFDIANIQEAPFNWFQGEVVRWRHVDAGAGILFIESTVLRATDVFVVFQDESGISYIPWSQIAWIILPEEGYLE